MIETGIKARPGRRIRLGLVIWRRGYWTPGTLRCDRARTRTLGPDCSIRMLLTHLVSRTVPSWPGHILGTHRNCQRHHADDTILGGRRAGPRSAVTIWAGWSVVTRALPSPPTFDAWDISFYALRNCRRGLAASGRPARPGRGPARLARTRFFWWQAAACHTCLLAAAGLQFAPAHHQAALNPGFMPLFVAALWPSWCCTRTTRELARAGRSLPHPRRRACYRCVWQSGDVELARWPWAMPCFWAAALLVGVLFESSMRMGQSLARCTQQRWSRPAPRFIYAPVYALHFSRSQA